MLTDEAIRNGVLKKVTEKRGNSEEPSRDGNVRDDNKRSRTQKTFTTITNPVRKEYTGATPKCPNCNYHSRVRLRVVNPLNARNLNVARGACFECGSSDSYKATCPTLNRAPRPGGNVQIKQWLSREDKVMETMATRNMEGLL
ncbi:hypothetical protein Tco_0003756 [Tanacetum coccineum]